MNQRVIQYLSIALFAALVVWGLFTFLYYLGVDVHFRVLLSTDATKAVMDGCDGKFCRGLHAFFPFLGNTIARMGPFAAYLIWSVVLYAAFLLWRAVRGGGELQRGMAIRPWHLLVLFAASIFLVFSVLAFGKTNVNLASGSTESMPLRQLVEPSPIVYRGVGEQGIQRLRANFDRLQNQGCLVQNGFFVPGVPQYLISLRCIYGSFFSLIATQFFFIAILLFELLVFGSFLISLLRWRPHPGLLDVVLSVAIGACGFVVVLWFLAIFSALTANAGWVLMLAVPVVCYRHVLYWGRMLHTAVIRVDRPWYDPMVVLAWLLVTYLAFNFITVVRPFPIGWDDLGSYLNRPRLMVSYGSFIFSMASFQWEYLTSLGFLLFGYKSTFGATASLLINWSAGLIATMSVYAFARIYLGRGSGLLSAILYYFLPLVGHFSYADMKIDNAVFAMGALSMLCLFRSLFPLPEEDQSDQREWQWIVLAGVLAGFAFSFKPTAVMVIVASVAILLGSRIHWLAAIGMAFGGMSLFMAQGVLDITSIAARVGITLDVVAKLAFLFVVTLVAGGFIAGACALARDKVKRAARDLLLFIGCITAVAAPWMMHNNIMRGRIIPRVEFGAPNTISPQFDLRGARIGEVSDDIVRSLPPELAIDLNSVACSPTGNLEELDRYWGFDKGWTHYLTLPWRTSMNLNSAGYYVTTMPGLLLFPLLLLLPFFWMPGGRWLRWLWIGTLFLLVQWMFLANGIPWYGIGMFLGLVIVLEALLKRAPDPLSRGAMTVLATLWILLMLGNRFWQFELQRNLFEYPMGKVSEEALKERTIPYYDDIADVVVSRAKTIPDRPYLYRVGTFLPYFIPRNLEIIGVSDHQLDFFKCIHQDGDPALTTKRLKALGFNSIVFDTNTDTIEHSQGSLHQKVQMFKDYVNNPASSVKMVLYDPAAGVSFIEIP